MFPLNIAINAELIECSAPPSEHLRVNVHVKRSQLVDWNSLLSTTTNFSMKNENFIDYKLETLENEEVHHRISAPRCGPSVCGITGPAFLGLNFCDSVTPEMLRLRVHWH